MKQNARGNEPFKPRIRRDIVRATSDALLWLFLLQKDSFHHPFRCQPSNLTVGQECRATELAKRSDNNANENFQHKKCTDKHKEDKKDRISTAVVTYRLHTIRCNVHRAVDNVQPTTKSNHSEKEQDQEMCESEELSVV
jgi:hypothetical protein